MISLCDSLGDVWVVVWRKCSIINSHSSAWCPALTDERMVQENAQLSHRCWSTFPSPQWSICRSGAVNPPHSTCQTPRLQLTEGCWTPSAVAFQNTDPDPLWPCWSANAPAYLLYDKRHLWSRCCLQHVFNIQAADCVIAARHPGGKSRHQLCVNNPLWRWFEIQQRLRKRGVQTWQLHPRTPETKAFLKIQQALDVVGSAFQIELTCRVSILCF